MKSVNVILGRNNSGKSALIDVVAKAVNHDVAFEQGHRGATAELEAYFPASDRFFDECLRGDKQADNRIEIKHPEYHAWIDPCDWAKAHLRSHVVQTRHRGGGHWHAFNIDGPVSTNHVHEHIRVEILKVLGMKPVVIPFKGKQFVRIAAERNIVPEQKAAELTIKPNGEGATNVFTRYHNERGLAPALVEKTVLDALNLIVQPDMSFDRISSRFNPNGGWEIELHDKEGERVSLTHMGSGVKTVLLVLLNLLVVPHIEKKKVADFVFGFEELENNLHPALQRRLFRFVRDFVVEEKSIVFLTTHSSVVIDLFSNDEAAQLLHVLHDGKSATVTTIDSWSRRHSALDDLGVRASDLLQSNGLIWVEGPSDRIYVNRWIELWTNGELKEGVHYRCVPYGGTVLAHFSASEPSETDVTDFIAVLQINRKAIVLMDRDRSDSEATPKDRVARIVKESLKSGVTAWVTKGREVENYIPLAALRSFLKKPELASQSEFVDVLELVRQELKRKSDIDKVDLAHRISKTFDRETLAATLDLPEKLDELCSKIREWNAMTESSMESVTADAR